MNPSVTAEQGASAVREAVRAMAAAQRVKRETLLERLTGLLLQVHPSMAGEVRETLLGTVERAHDEHLQRLGEINTALERLLFTLNRGAVSGDFPPVEAEAASVSTDSRLPPRQSTESLRPAPQKRSGVKA